MTECEPHSKLATVTNKCWLVERSLLWSMSSGLSEGPRHEVQRERLSDNVRSDFVLKGMEKDALFSYILRAVTRTQLAERWLKPWGGHEQSRCWRLRQWTLDP